jgi:hypothetical protein
MQHAGRRLFKNDEWTVPNSGLVGTQHGESYIRLVI